MISDSRTDFSDDTEIKPLPFERNIEVRMEHDLNDYMLKVTSFHRFALSKNSKNQPFGNESASNSKRTVIKGVTLHPLLHRSREACRHKHQTGDLATGVIGSSADSPDLLTSGSSSLQRRRLSTNFSHSLLLTPPMPLSAEIRASRPTSHFSMHSRVSAPSKLILFTIPDTFSSSLNPPQHTALFVN